MITHDDPVSPKHYRSHPSGIECIEISRYLPGDLAQALQYVWRFEEKNGLEDLRKARWFLTDHIEHLMPLHGGRFPTPQPAESLLARAARAEGQAPRSHFLYALSCGFLRKACGVLDDMIAEAEG